MRRTSATMSSSLSSNVSASGDDQARRRSVFYVPLFESFDNYLPLTPEEREALITGQDLDSTPVKPKRRNVLDSGRLHIPTRGDSSFTESESDISVLSPERRFRRPLSSTVSSNEALTRVGQRELTSPRLVAESGLLRHTKPRLRSTTSCEPRYDRIYSPMGGSISSSKLNSSTSNIGIKAAARNPILNSNLCLIPDSPKLLTPGKEKSKTLPQNLNTPSPIRGSSSSTSIFRTPRITVTPESPNKSPGKISGLNFIRRSRSTKLSRSNSLLRSITTRHIEEGLDDQTAVVTDLTDDYDKFVDDHGGENEVIGALIKKHEAQMANSPLSIRRGYLDVDDDVAVHSDTSYEKACRRGSAPSTPVPGAQPQHSPSRLASFFFSKRSFRSNPLKRTKSATKLERERALAAVPTHPPGHALRTSRSHESLLSAHSPAVSTMDLGPPNQVEIRALHSSVLGRAHCFALSAENRPPRYFACASRKERDRWIYSLRQAARPDEIRTRRCERTVKLWLLEAKDIPPKKRYYCEILLDDTLYARSSSKLKTDLCFWGEVYEFGALPAVRAIHVNVYREPERRARKRDKHALVGTVRIPVDDVSSRYLNERWYPLSEGDKPQSPGGRNPAPLRPALRIKCRYQSVDVLPQDHYARFLDYLKRNYKRLCEYLEPVIGVKAKEDIGCALVLCMAGAGHAPRYLADVVALDVRRTGDHSLTFRGNSLATKSMEAYLKLVGDQYLQDTLGEAVSAAAGPGAAECEVDPLRAGSGAALRRQQTALRDAVTLAWRSIASSAPRFPPPLRDCFATFRERLISMGREDISDNLISASIFLRFLCPAILSPSLFGITHEYPNERAARNLTLVAKTLQTLANFTRFQGKEAFMEFLNDFLEQEAPNMKAFLRAISTRPQDQQQQHQQPQPQAQHEGSNRNSAGSESPQAAAVDADPEWAPHVDIGKQLATLHGLLVDSLPKLPPNRIQELDPLSDILDELSKRLVSNDLGPPTQITDNIFRFNDPTCNSTPAKPTNVETPTNGQINSNFAHSSPIMNKNGVQFNISPSKSNAEESKYKNSYVAVSKSPSFNLRSATLPRNGYGSNQNVNPDRYSSQYNSQEHCVNPKVLQIGFGSDQYPKGISNGISESLERRFQDRYKPNNYNQQTHYHNSNYNSTERSPSSDSINHNYSVKDMQNIIKETATLEELSDLLKYADDSDIVDDKLMNKKNLAQSKSNNNNIVNGNKTNYTSNGSNVSISGLSNVASSGYQSIATYSQSSSPIENTAHLHQAYENGGQPMSRYSQLNYQKQRDKQYYDNKNDKFYPKSPVQQKIDYDIQKYGIQNFTTADNNSQSNSNINSKIAPLVFTNPVYNMEDNRQAQEKKRNDNRNSKRCPCGSSSSSIDEEGLSTDNVETNSEEGSTNFNDDQQNRNNTHRKLTRDNCNYEDVYQMSNHSHSPRTRDDESSSNSPSLRKSSKTRMPRTNPMLSYSTNQNQLNLKHFGQRGESLYESKPHHISTDSGYPMSRSDSNVEEVNKEMYRLQISRSQKALYNMENSKNSPEKYSLSENKIPETNYPLDRTYSGAKMSSSRLNEDLERHQDYYGVRERRDSPQTVFNRESQSSEANDRAAMRSEREIGGRDKLQRRLSLESARELTDSSDDMEDTLYSTTGRRRASKHQRTIEQYEREIERLKCSVELLRGRLPAEPGQDHTDAKMKAIISRLICVEEELRREQRKMAAALSHKQRVIEAQEHRIAALDEANTRLLSALVHLQQRAPHPAPAHPPSHNNSHPSPHSHQELQI
ncbi:ras GTPase-activating protein raskol isoform X3 [Plodia interpunctella]|uniref:ras GTPase-activating protein raskol isoform X3 n=1 Tax=Plodia interpunctella TaxID=58824 RepID=UPI0023685F03|nr:ras GTPase-activating protein raskol isoform X3 [Plodia interpunctella]XP_053601321.1 ras GTPase-activating protein raskol isoform X3 [Plodia interpunctella]XP_053601322.1 ras GTPase-activating protein raskol isoform X3 [Plodia interpunctella]